LQQGIGTPVPPFHLRRAAATAPRGQVAQELAGKANGLSVCPCPLVAQLVRFGLRPRPRFKELARTIQGFIPATRCPRGSGAIPGMRGSTSPSCGCIGNGPGRKQARDIGFSLPGKNHGRHRLRLFFIDGKKVASCRGGSVAADFNNGDRLYRDPLRARRASGRASAGIARRVGRLISIDTDWTRAQALRSVRAVRAKFRREVQ